MKEHITKTKTKNSDQDVILNKSGTIIRERNFQQDKLHGPINVYYDDGTPKLQGEFDNNNRVGTWKHFNHELKLILEETC